MLLLGGEQRGERFGRGVGAAPGGARPIAERRTARRRARRRRSGRAARRAASDMSRSTPARPARSRARWRRRPATPEACRPLRVGDGGVTCSIRVAATAAACEASLTAEGRVEPVEVSSSTRPGVASGRGSKLPVTGEVLERRERCGTSAPPAGCAGEQILDPADHHLRLERLDQHAVAAYGPRPAPRRPARTRRSAAAPECGPAGRALDERGDLVAVPLRHPDVGQHDVRRCRLERARSPAGRRRPRSTVMSSSANVSSMTRWIVTLSSASRSLCGTRLHLLDARTGRCSLMKSTMLLHRAARQEDPLDAHRLQLRDVDVRDDAADHDEHVVQPLLLQQLHHARADVHVRARQDRQADRRRRLPAARRRRSARASGAGRCRSPPCPRRAARAR